MRPRPVSNGMNSFDLSLFRWLNSWGGLSGFWDFVIVFRGEYFLWVILIALLFFPLSTFLPRFLLKRAKNIELFLFALFSGLVARFVVTEAIRFFYNRPRPFEILGDVVQLINHSGGGSFPSGHTSFAFALATIVSFYYPRTSTLFFLAAFSIGVARVAAGVHWPTDIIGGALVGIGTAWALRFFLFRLSSRVSKN